MNPMKRLGLVALLVFILGGLFAASPALARKIAGVSSTTFKLMRPANAPEPTASGQWTLHRDDYMMTEDVTVSCRRLTPGRQYVVVVLVHWSQWGRIGYEPWTVDSGSYPVEVAVTADAKGRLNAQCTVVSTWSYGGGVNRSVQDLWIENDAGNVVLE
jgi:hypothetical protein